MDQPKFYRDEEGNVVELKPVVVDQASLENDLAVAQKHAEEVDGNVAKLEGEVEELTQRLSAVNTVLAKQYDDQEAAQEELTFRQARLDGFNSATPLSADVANAAPSATPENMDGGGDDDPAPDEDLAEGDDAEGTPAEQEASSSSEEQTVPVRRRSQT